MSGATPPHTPLTTRLVCAGFLHPSTDGCSRCQGIPSCIQTHQASCISKTCQLSMPPLLPCVTFTPSPLHTHSPLPDPQHFLATCPGRQQHDIMFSGLEAVCHRCRKCSHTLGFFQFEMAGGIFQLEWSTLVTGRGGECMTGTGGEPTPRGTLVCLNFGGSKGSTGISCILMMRCLAPELYCGWESGQQ